MTPGSHSPASSSGASDSGSASGDDVERELERDPYYFVVDNCVLKYQGGLVVISSVDRQRNACSVAHFQNPQHVVASNVPLQLIEHHVPDGEEIVGDQKVKVVAGKLNGEFGTLIGIDNDEAVVQLQATTEVNILPKRFIVMYVDT